MLFPKSFAISGSLVITLAPVAWFNRKNGRILRRVRLLLCFGPKNDHRHLLCLLLLFSRQTHRTRENTNFCGTSINNLSPIACVEHCRDKQHRKVIHLLFRGSFPHPSFALRVGRVRKRKAFPGVFERLVFGIFARKLRGLEGDGKVLVEEIEHPPRRQILVGVARLLSLPFALGLCRIF